MYRQGDVMLIPVESVPAIARPGAREGDQIVLAYGEVTGHKHVIDEPSVGIFEHEGTRYIRVPEEGSSLRHEEHGTIALAPGSYQVRIQKEYSPQALRNVAD